MHFMELVLTENEIEAIINGETINKKVGEQGSVSIRQSYIKDIASPIINRPNKVVDTENNKVLNKHYAHMLEDGFYTLYESGSRD